tara:strand:- start:3289 stop:3816 length:528 start_codon:yes stop_codon:yes gene_type:complete
MPPKKQSKKNTKGALRRSSSNGSRKSDSSSKSKSPTDVCSICLDDYDKSQNYCVLPCRHKFHFTCMATHMRSRHGGDTCPNCRAPLLPSQRTEVNFDRLRINVPRQLRDAVRRHIQIGRDLFANTSVYIWKLGEAEDDISLVIRNNDGDRDMAYLPDGEHMGYFSNIPDEELEEV